MKTSKLFKKSALLIAVIVCAVVLTVTAIAAATLLLVEDDFGVDYYGASVATAGRAKINFYFDDVGTAEKFVVRVVEPSNVAPAEEAGVQEYDVECLVDNMSVKGEQKYISVPLAPSQMTYTVQVYAVKGSEKSLVAEKSVREYAEDVLADPKLSGYHNSMVALLNWGAMAQDYFNQAEAYPANAGLFARGTNPKDAISAINAPDFKATAAGGFTTPTYQLYLAPEDVYVQLNFAYSGEGELSANVSKDGAEAKPTTVHKNEDGTCYVKLSNLGVTVYDSTYTVTVTDGTDTLTFNGSLLGILKGYLDKEAANVVKSMYQFYQQTVAPVTACNHGNRSQTFWVAEGENAARIKCSICYAEIGHQIISNDVNDYIPGELLQFGNQTGSSDVTVMSEDGVQFVRVDNMWANRDNWGDIGFTNALSSNTVTGQYMVIKYRVGAEGNAATYVEAYVNTNQTDKKNLQGAGGTKILNSNADEWVTAIVDLSTRVTDPSVAFVPAEDGSYDVQYISLRLFPYAAQTVTDDSAAGRYHYIYKYTEGGSAKYEFFQNTKLTEEQLAEKVAAHADYALYRISKQTTSADAYVDVAYVAFADSMADIKTLIDTQTYTVSVSNTANEVYNTADDSCAHGSRDIKEYREGNTYYYGKCVQCGEYLYSKTVPESVSLYFSPNSLYTQQNSNSVEQKTTYDTLYLGDKIGFYVDADNAYIRLNGRDSVAQWIWNRGPGVNGYSAGNDQDYTVNVGKATHLVIKMKVTNTSETWGLQLSSAGVDSSVGHNLPTANMTSGEWTTVVIDLAKVFTTQYAANAEGDYLIDTFYFHVPTFSDANNVDFAYFAFVEGGLNAVKDIVDTDTVLLQNTKNGAGYKLDPETCKCADGCTTSVQVIDGVYKTACTTCGNVVRDHGVKADAVNAYWSAEYLYTCITKTGTSESKWSSVTGQYHQKEFITEDGETFIRIGDAETNHADNGPWVGWFIGSSDAKNGVPGAGRYMVMKVRQNNNSVNNTSLGMWITSKEGFSSWAAGSVSVALPEDNQWHTIVVDLAARSDAYKPTVATGEYDLGTFHIRPFGGGSAVDKSTDEVMDLAYIAFFDDLADLKNIIKEDSFEFSKSGSSSAILETATGTCKFHTPTYVADADDARGYHYECAECGIKLAMDYYESGKGGCFSMNAQYAGTYTLKTDAEGFKYMSFLSTGTTGTFFNYNANNTGGGGVSANAVRAGRYLVMKIKGDTAANVTFHVGTDDKPKSNNNYVGGLAATFTPETMPKDWTVVVFDLASIPNYSIGENHKIFMSSTTGGGTVVATGAQVDVAYVMLVNDYDDIASLTANETVKSFVIPDEINWYANLDSMGKYQHTLQKNLYDSEEEVLFNRYTGTGGNHLNLTGGTGNAGVATSGTFPTGKYIAIKYRLWVENGTGTFNFNVATGDKKSGNGKSIGSALSYTSVEQGKWRVAFVDASQTEQWTSDGTAQSIYMMITTGGTGTYTFDIAWLAVVDSVEEMKLLLTSGETYYDVGNDWSKQEKHLKQDGTCVAHSATETANGNTYTYTCSVCGTTVKTIELDSSVTRYYSAKALNTTAKVYYGGSGNAYRYDADANVGYMETSRIQTIWQRMDHDMATTQTAAESEQYSENVGNAKYLVIKARSSDAAAYLRFLISTTAKNCQIGTITEADFTDDVLNSTKASYYKILENGQTDAKTLCTAVGDQYYHGSSMKSVYLMATGAATGEWMTYVIDLEAVCGEYYAKAEGQDYYDVDSFYFHNAGTNDIAYAAFVEGSWAEIDALVEEDVVTQITAGGTSAATVGKLVNVADGSDAQ